MTNPGKNKGDRGELEVQGLLRKKLRLPNVRRALGAGRKDDVGDIDGVPNTAIQVKWLASPMTAINQGLKEIEVQRRNRRVRFGAVFVRRTQVRENPWIVVQTVDDWVRMWKYAQMGVALEREQKSAKMTTHVTRSGSTDSRT